MDKLENQVQSECLQLLRAYNIFHWRQNTGAYRVNGRLVRSASITGISDILGILPDGRLLAIECKRSKGGRVSDQQQDFLQNIIKNSGVALVISDSEELQKWLNDYMNGNYTKNGV